MGILDIILGIPLVWGIWKGLKNGLLMEVASIVALVAGIYGAIKFSYITVDYLSKQMQWDERNINIIAFVLTFIIIIILVHLAGKLLTKVVNIAMLGIPNKIAGAAFGALKVSIILGAIVLFFNRVDNVFNLLDDKTKTESILYTPIKKIGTLVFDSAITAKKEKEESK